MTQRFARRRQFSELEVSAFGQDESGRIEETILRFAPGVLENAPSQVRSLAENLARARACLRKTDLSRQPWKARRSFLFRHLKRTRHPKGGCMYPDCENASIRRSHAISRAGSLSIIAEAGHVVRPAIHARTGNVQIQRIGLRQASTFPGFCRIHELEFGRFENTKACETEDAWILQLFRTACWELRTVTDGIGTLKRMRAAYNSRVDESLKGLLRLDGLRARSRNLDDQQRLLTESIARLAKHRARFAREIFAPLKRDLIDGGCRMRGLTLVIDIVLPLCLAGSGAFTWLTLGNGRKRNVLALLQVLPTVTGTRIGMLAPAATYDCIAGYFIQSVNHTGGLATMLQTWMTHGTEQWFLKPSVWSTLPQATRSAIEGALGPPYDLAEVCDHGLFADILSGRF